MEIGETTPFAGSSMNSKSIGNYFKQFFYPKTNWYRWFTPLKLILGSLLLSGLVKCVLNTPNIRIMEIGETTPFAGSSMSSESIGNYFKQFSILKLIDIDDLRD